MNTTQQHRSLAATSPLGEDVLLLRSMYGSERVGRLFEYRLMLHSQRTDIRPKDLLGQSMTVRLALNANGSNRYFDGVVSRFAHVGFSGGFASYEATLVPWLWLLTRTSDCRTFQNKTVPDILREIFSENGFGNYKLSLSESYRPWGYCVQYRETDFSFISRLMEQEGIYYYCTHENGKHTVVLCDGPGAHQPVSGYETVPYYPPDDAGVRERDHLDHWSMEQSVQPGAYAHTDFDFTAPKRNLKARRDRNQGHAYSSFEVYDYPGEYEQPDAGETYARRRLEELHAAFETVTAAGDARGLSTGCVFSLSKYPREDQNRRYLILGCDYQLQSDAFASTPGGGAGPQYRLRLEAMDASLPYRPPRATPKPVVQGPQTAVIVGKASEEIYTDKYGRVKVQFHWDRYGKRDENSSCWVRVAQPWAGASWGGIAIPRIGQEVIVEFLDGDPDRPIITGRVYNEDNMPPYSLPGNKTQSGLKSRSTKGGGSANFNEIRMEDKKGAEQLYIHAEKNQDNVVEHDETTKVGHNRTETVDMNERVTIGANRSVTIGGNKTETVAIAKAETIGAAKALTIGGAYQVSVGTVMNTTVGLAQAEQVGLSKNVVVGKKFYIEAADELEIVVGASSLVMKSDGTITIKGTFLNASGANGVKIEGKVVDLN